MAIPSTQPAPRHAVIERSPQGPTTGGAKLRHPRGPLSRTDMRRPWRFGGRGDVDAMARPRATGSLAVLAVLSLVLVLRMPSARWDAISDDEGIYDATAQVLNAGGLLYRDAVDHKPPGLAFTYAAIGGLVGPQASGSARMAAVHAFGALVALGTALGLWVLGRRFLSRRAQIYAPLLFALSSTAKVPFDGLAVNGELLMGLPSIWALVLVEAAGRQLRWRQCAADVLAGLLLAAAVLLKWQAALLALPMAMIGLSRGMRVAGFCMRALSWGLGLALGLGATALAFARRDGLGDAIYWGLLFNRHYLASGTRGAFWWKRLGQGLAGAVLPSMVLYGAGLSTMTRWLRHPRMLRIEAAVAMWALLALSAVALGGRFFGHYFLQAELPLCLLAATPVATRWQDFRRPRWLGPVLVLPSLGFFLLACWPAQALRWLNAHDPVWPTLGRQVAGYQQPGDTLFVWGNAPLLHHFSGLPMGTRYSFCNYLTGMSPATPSERNQQRARGHGEATERAWQALADDLRIRKPTLIVDTAHAGIKGYGQYPMRGHRLLRNLLATQYDVAGSAQGAIVYRRHEGVSPMVAVGD